MSAASQTTSLHFGAGTITTRSGRPSAELAAETAARQEAQRRRERDARQRAFVAEQPGTSSNVRSAMAAASSRVSVSGSNARTLSVISTVDMASRRTTVVVRDDGSTETWEETTRTGGGRVSVTRIRRSTSRDEETDADAVVRSDLTGASDEEVSRTLAAEASADSVDAAAAAAVAAATEAGEPGTTADVETVFEGEADPDDPDAPPSMSDVAELRAVLSETLATVIEASPTTELPAAVAARTDTVVRRPTLGLVSYEDRFCRLEMFAKSLEGGEGEYIPMFNSTYSSARHPVNTNFLINQVSLNAEESVQVVRTFGDYYLSDVGESPRTLSVQGVLIESKNFPWLSEWRANYDQYLRARQCILRKAMAYLTIDDTMYAGYIISSSISRNVTPAWELVPFSFTMVLRSATDLRAENLFGTSQASAGDRTQGLLASNIGDPDASSLAQVAELVSGYFDEGAQLLEPAPLEFSGSVDEAVTRVNLDHLVDVARRINASRGSDLINLQGLRNGYLSQRMAEFAAIGVSSPETLQTYGFPSRYEMSVSARRARVQEEYREAIEAGVEAAREGISNWKIRL